MIPDGTVAFIVRYERAVLEAIAITGRSEGVIKRGFRRMRKMSQSSAQFSGWDIQREWRRRVLCGEWGQRGRLRRLGIAV